MYIIIRIQFTNKYHIAKTLFYLVSKILTHNFINFLNILISFRFLAVAGPDVFGPRPTVMLQVRDANSDSHLHPAPQMVASPQLTPRLSSTFVEFLGMTSVWLMVTVFQSRLFHVELMRYVQNRFTTVSGLW